MPRSELRSAPAPPIATLFNASLRLRDFFIYWFTFFSHVDGFDRAAIADIVERFFDQNQGSSDAGILAQSGRVILQISPNASVPLQGSAAPHAVLLKTPRDSPYACVQTARLPFARYSVTTVNDVRARKSGAFENAYKNFLTGPSFSVYCYRTCWLERDALLCLIRFV